MKIGFNEATARDCSTLEMDVELCEAAGFDAIEIRIDMLKSYLKNHSKEELKALLVGRRIQPINLNAIYPYAGLFSAADDPERRERFLEEFRFACGAARFIGANALVLCPPLMADRKTPFDLPEEEQTRMNVGIVSRLAKIAADTDTKLCFEIVGAPYSSCRSVAQARAILKGVNMPNVGLAVDSYNIYMGNLDDSFADVRSLCPEEIFVAHINDADYVPPEQIGDQSKRCFCGRGVLNVAAYLDSLRHTGYNGVVSIETFRPEYWQRAATWVIGEAFRTTSMALRDNHCL